MLKTPNIAGRKRNQPQADQETWLVFMELEVAVQANEKEKISVAFVLNHTCYDNNLISFRLREHQGRGAEGT